jgi:hypothetical protein
MSVKKFRKKPIVIEAIQWDGSNLKEIIEFVGLHPSANLWTWNEYKEVVKKDGLKIFTLGGKMNADVGDFIIKGIKGEFYPCKPDIFEQTYEDEAKVDELMRYPAKEYIVQEDVINDDNMDEWTNPNPEIRGFKLVKKEKEESKMKKK